MKQVIQMMMQEAISWAKIGPLKISWISWQKLETKTIQEIHWKQTESSTLRHSHGKSRRKKHSCSVHSDQTSPWDLPPLHWFQSTVHQLVAWIVQRAFLHVQSIQKFSIIKIYKLKFLTSLAFESWIPRRRTWAFACAIIADAKVSVATLKHALMLMPNIW